MVKIGCYLDGTPTAIDVTKKGKSILKRLDDYTCIDLETTGLSSDWDRIIEVGACRIRNGEIVERYSSLVYADYLDSYITYLTGITVEMLADAPKSSEVLLKLKEFIGDDIIIGHNVTFDIDFIFKGLAEEGIYLSNDFVNTLRLARRIIPVPQVTNHKLSTLVKELNIPANGFHRALADAESTVWLYEYLKKIADERSIDFSNLEKHSPKLDAKQITSSKTEFDESHPLFGKTCVFTGTLSIPRKDAMQMVADIGGISGNGINKSTNYLIVGNLEYSSSIKNGKSGKLKKAEEYILNGQDLTILDESAFFALLNED